MNLNNHLPSRTKSLAMGLHREELMNAKRIEIASILRIMIAEIKGDEITNVVIRSRKCISKNTILLFPLL